MKPIETTRLINAPRDRVFEVISRPEGFCEAVTPILRVEILSETRAGVGTHFRETRSMNGKETSVVLEIAESITNERVRMVSEAGGTIWDTVFTVEDADRDRTRMQMVMEIKPKRLLSRILNPMIRGMVVRGVESDMDEVKKYCESDFSVGSGAS
ncbi:MAG: SRPBCC family protein [Planctomycetota bacterium]